MNLNDLIKRTRSYVRDDIGALFSQEDIANWINEAIDRVKEVIYPLKGMELLRGNSDSPILMPDEWHHLLSIYSASRCSTQDEQEYRGSNFMSEFEAKLAELKQKIDNGDIIIYDTEGNPLPPKPGMDSEMVNNVYFKHYWFDDEGGY